MTYPTAKKFMNSCRKEDFKNANDAFGTLIKIDRVLHGTSYSGSVGMKNKFKMVYPTFHADPTEEDYLAWINNILDTDEFTKYGPAGCIETDDGWLFFGWASC